MVVNWLALQVLRDPYCQSACVCLSVRLFCPQLWC